MAKLSPQQRIQELTNELRFHAKLYYQHDAPVISDEAYDDLYHELLALEKEYPEFRDPLSPTIRVGGKVLDSFQKIHHTFRQWSYDNVFSLDEFRDWETRQYTILGRDDHKTLGAITYIVELKIDGLKVILDYDQGRFVRGATRGDGVIGEDITENLKTVRSIPLTVPEQGKFTVIGEAWISRNDFANINMVQEAQGGISYANPRNLAAGTLRQLDTRVVAERHLQTFMYDIESTDFSFATHMEELDFLKEQGFQVNDATQLFASLIEVQEWYQMWVSVRNEQPYAVDGMVIKINQKDVCKILGYTAKAPRFGIAYKFPAQEKTTTLQDIILQTGRTGVLTPVAVLRPVDIDGSTVSRATLHNESEILRLDLHIGDTVVVEKSGDIIPKVKQVFVNLRPKDAVPFSVAQYLQEEGIEATREVSDHGVISWYVNTDTVAEVHIQNLIHFCSKKAANIDGLGDKIVRLLYRHELVRKRSDFFGLQFEDLVGLPSFKERASQNILDAIQTSRDISFDAFIFSLGIVHVGQEVARIYARSFADVATWRHTNVEELESLYGIGAITALSTMRFLEDEDNQHELDCLISYFRIRYQQVRGDSGNCKDKIFVITGTFSDYSRDELANLIRSCGGKVSDSVSTKTNHVIAGENPGSKLAKAQDLQVSVITLEEFFVRYQ